MARLLGMLCTSALAAVVVAGRPGAEPLTGTYTTYGTPGLIEMPTAESAPDAELAATYARVGEQSRTTLTFQLMPRLSGSFRYSVIPGYERNGGDRYDRSFDLRYRLLDESAWLPAVAIGLQDFIGTGLYSSEYVVATKTVGPQQDFRFSAGLGWGRLGTRNVVAGEPGTRVTGFRETGGTANFDRFFTGPVGAFGGVAWNVSDALTLKAEYSSDEYSREQERDLVDPESPWNFGVDYEIAEGARLAASYVNGTDLGVQLTLSLNPRTPPFGPGLDDAPLPVQARPSPGVAPQAWRREWIVDSGAREAIRTNLSETLAEDGIALQAVSLQADAVEVRVRNERWAAASQAVGRTARVLSRTMPSSVERFTIVPVVDGVPNAAVTLSRTDVERLEGAPGERILARAVVTGGAGRPPGDLVTMESYPKLTYGIGPYWQTSLFDPDQPVRGNVGLSFAGELALAPGLVLSGRVRQPVFGNLDQITRKSNSVLPRVRSDFRLFYDDKEPELTNLTAAHYGRLGDTMYSRVTAGYLERMYAGVSGEVLWKPVDSRLALGAELNYVQQRDPDSAFGLGDLDAVTGHASAYYDIGNGYYGQVDAGRYLAGDYGATFSVDRVFDNGWRIGAYATFTDVPFEEFGEGSFDKGIKIEVPLAWLSGQPTRRKFTTVIQPLTRDGGARVFVDGRLYRRVVEDHRPSLDDSAGRFWK